MGIFGKIKSSVAKIFGKKVIEPSGRHFRPEEAADIAAGGQAQRRRKLLERRVKSGESEEVYPNRKKIHSEASLAGGAGDSPYIEDFLNGFPLSRFASSNVWALCYDRTKDTLHMQFMAGAGRKKSGPGRWYAYKSVSIAEAKVAYNTASKGVFNWRYMRGKKQFVKDSPPPSYLPLGRKRSNILDAP